MDNKSLKSVFEKQGGFKLIKQYIKAGCLHTAFFEFCLLGKSRTALELLRMSTQLKTIQKLKKRYGKLLDSYCALSDNGEHKKNDTIWICWFQGMEQAPPIVKKCYESVRKNITGRPIVLITKDNLSEYVQFPAYIQKKVDTGIIKGAHLSDLIRLELLINYGGTWIDSTVFVSDSNIPDYMLDSELFLFQNLKPGRDGHSTVISNWFITAWSNNRILKATRLLLFEYWKDNDSLIDYYIFHICFQMAIERFSDEWDKVVPFNNSTPHILLLRLFDEYDDVMWTAISGQTPIHKLSYKLEDKDKQKVNTYYRHILERS